MSEPLLPSSPLAATPPPEAAQAAESVPDFAAPASATPASAAAGAPGSTPGSATSDAAAPNIPPSAVTPLSITTPALPGWAPWVLALLALSSAGGLWQSWNTGKRVQALEQELVRRQQDSQGVASEARMLAKEARDATRETAARTTLLEARVAEVALQRSQLEELIQSLARSRDENLVTDVDAALRVAQQQAALTGSAEPLVATLKASDERIARVNQPRLEGVRRAIARDLDRVKSTGMSDIATLVIRIDEAMRLADELPLLRERGDAAGRMRRGDSRSAATAQRSDGPSDDMAAPSAGPSTGPGASPTALAASSAAPAGDTAAQWLAVGRSAWDTASSRVWQEIHSLIRVSRIDQPEGMLIAPDQGFFLRENVKLKLLNARAALLSRQFLTAQNDVRSVLDVLPRYFDGNARKTQLARDLLQQVLTQSGHVSLPRPDETLAAISAIAAGR